MGYDPAVSAANFGLQQVLMAVLQRLTGDPEGAERNLREFLDRIRDVPVNGKEGIGFTRFTVYAFLGETDAAIAALEEAIRADWLPGWWGLKDGDFDPIYAKVVADPRFKRLYAEIPRASSKPLRIVY